LAYLLLSVKAINRCFYFPTLPISYYYFTLVINVPKIFVNGSSSSTYHRKRGRFYFPTLPISYTYFTLVINVPKIFVNGSSSSTYHRKRGRMFFLKHSVQSKIMAL